MQHGLTTLLSTLRRENRQQSGLDPSLVPPDVGTAYTIAADIGRELGWSVGGWKIAAMKAEMQRALRTDRPIYGRVFKQFILASRTNFAGRRLLHPLSEIEYAALLGKDMPPREQPYSESEVADAILSLHPGLELAECRFVHDASFPPLTAILADGSGSGFIIYGEPIADWRSKDIAGQEAVLWVNGVVKRRGRAADAIDHPLVPLTWLANELSRTGIGLKAGAMVSTGTLTGMALARPGDEHVADYGPLGEVRIKFSA
ncbi:2-keto-4-pentenoate hydratase [Bradyrhizobium sp. AUGA SZCCT0182]|uniref:2-keto-4-pentenoate hydratase n=1 Tax=Bradyrhizobium sp. AUGA SZCCT0182 TaxID=2807667 RepID=UPI001BAD580E|nr:fumarylacetoacetate hydrolase family protein [Bradyrhizobium sp. AUGA SZCCT0182]MBR1233502.1 fumarylacetoacetate hydrolase family protein [Bradyrhizobium sp. AUGA SZCCT0182]